MVFPNHFDLYIIAALIANAVPGIAVMGSFTTSLKYGLKAATFFSLGLVTASFIYFIVSGLGLIILVNDYAYVFNIVKYLGIGYLFYLGVQCIVSKQENLDWVEVEQGNDHKLWHLYLSGLLIHLTNPKNILFFVAVLPQYIILEKSLTQQIFWLSVGSEIPEFLLLIVYAYFAKILKPILVKPGIAHKVNMFIGILYIGLATMLLII